MNETGLEPVTMTAVNRVRGRMGYRALWNFVWMEICSDQCCNDALHVTVKHMKCGYWD